MQIFKWKFPPVFIDEIQLFSSNHPSCPFKCYQLPLLLEIVSTGNKHLLNELDIQKSPLVALLSVLVKGMQNKQQEEATTVQLCVKHVILSGTGMHYMDLISTAQSFLGKLTCDSHLPLLGKRPNFFTLGNFLDRKLFKEYIVKEFFNFNEKQLDYFHSFFDGPLSLHNHFSQVYLQIQWRPKRGAHPHHTPHLPRL